jgi:hypothetical protein
MQEETLLLDIRQHLRTSAEGAQALGASRAKVYAVLRLYDALFF